MCNSQWRKFVLMFTAAMVGAFAFFAATPDASAIPSFSRKYKAACTTCHTVYPMLNSFGEAFRRNGYRFPSQDGSRDLDNQKAEALELGQEEYKKLFPNAVWPDQILQAVPLSIMTNGSVSYNFPSSDAHAAAGNAFSWNGITSELHLFAGGAFTDTTTYFAQLTVNSAGVDIETGYLLFNDLVGPRHWINLWVGRLSSPALTSFGLHSSYLSDAAMPGTSIAALYNPTGTFSLGHGHTDGVELNGVIRHRLSWALGFIASGAITGLKLPTSEDVYAHVGYKIAGVTLDGEGLHGVNVIDAKRPWAETSLTLDGFMYHGLNVMDNGTAIVAGPNGQFDPVNAIGGSLRLQVESFILMAGAQLERHEHPYQGTPGDPTTTPPTPAAADLTPGTAFSQYNEADYVIFPWLVPGLRTEFTRMTTRQSVDGNDTASLIRVIPGVAALIFPNVKLSITGVFEHAYGVTPTASWGGAGGFINSPAASVTKVEAEQVNVNLAWAY